MTQRNEAHAPRRSSDSLTDRLPEGHDFLAARSVKQQLLGELRAGWESGQPARVEDLLGHWPTDPDTDPDAASLLFEEYCQRGRVGDPLTPEEIERRFPSQKSFFTSLSCQQGLLRSLGGENCG